MSSQPLNVFITGSTGYIGGEFLYKILNESNLNVKVRALVRSEAKSKLLLSKTTNVETVIGDLDDSDVLAEEFAKADIIVNAATNNHLPSVKVLEKVLAKKTSQTLVFHISGVSILASIEDKSHWSDIDDNKKIISLGDDRPHIEVDRTIWNLQKTNPNVRTVIIAPPNIFGESHGYDNIYSKQIPDLIKYSLKLGQVFTVEDGEFDWSHVNINYLGDLFLIVLGNLLKDRDSVKTGTEGIYFAATGDHSWREVSVEVAKLLKEKGAIDTEEIKELTRDEVNKLIGTNYSPLLGSFALTKADLAKSYGWAPANTHLFWINVKKSVESALK